MDDAVCHGILLLVVKYIFVTIITTHSARGGQKIPKILSKFLTFVNLGFMRFFLKKT
jgi:hypothetical protein